MKKNEEENEKKKETKPELQNADQQYTANQISTTPKKMNLIEYLESIGAKNMTQEGRSTIYFVSRGKK